MSWNTNNWHAKSQQHGQAHSQQQHQIHHGDFYQKPMRPLPNLLPHKQLSQQQNRPTQINRANPSSSDQQTLEEQISFKRWKRENCLKSNPPDLSRTKNSTQQNTTQLSFTSTQVPVNKSNFQQYQQQPQEQQLQQQQSHHQITSQQNLQQYQQQPLEQQLQQQSQHQITSSFKFQHPEHQQADFQTVNQYERTDYQQQCGEQSRYVQQQKPSSFHQNSSWMHQQAYEVSKPDWNNRPAGSAYKHHEFNSQEMKQGYQSEQMVESVPQFSFQQKEFPPPSQQHWQSRQTSQTNPQRQSVFNVSSTSHPKPARQDNSQQQATSGRQSGTLQIISCTAESFHHWSIFTDGMNLLYELFGTVSDVTYKNNRMTLSVKGRRLIVDCIFYSMDRCLPTLIIGDSVRAVGKLDQKKESMLMCISLRLATHDERCNAMKIVQQCDMSMQRCITMKNET